MTTWTGRSSEFSASADPAVPATLLRGGWQKETTAGAHGGHDGLPVRLRPGRGFVERPKAVDGAIRVPGITAGHAPACSRARPMP